MFLKLFRWVASNVGTFILAFLLALVVLVSAVIDLLGKTGGETVTLASGRRTSLRHALTCEFTLGRSRPDLFMLLANHVTARDEQQALEQLIAAEENPLASADLAEVLERFPSAHPPLADLLDTLARSFGSALKFVGRWTLEERYPGLHHRFGNIETCWRRLHISYRQPLHQLIRCYIEKVDFAAGPQQLRSRPIVFAFLACVDFSHHAIRSNKRSERLRCRPPFTNHTVDATI